MEYKKTSTTQRKEVSSNQVGKNAVQLKDNRQGIVQRVKEADELKGSTFAQFFGGLATATANVFGYPTDELFPKVDTHLKGELPSGRRELEDVVAPRIDDETLPDTSLVKTTAKMIRGQNATQSYFGEPVGDKAIEGFDKQLTALEDIKDEPFSKQYALDSLLHEDLSQAFLEDYKVNPNSGLKSGYYLHKFGSKYAKMMSGVHSVGEDPSKQEFMASFLKYQVLDDTNYSGGAGNFSFLDKEVEPKI